MAEDWIEKARTKMGVKGTVGKFGEATGPKIAAGKSAGGVLKKRAVFAQTMKRLAQKRSPKP